MPLLYISVSQFTKIIPLQTSTALGSHLDCCN